MAQFDNTNRGQIWRNEKKTTDSHPDFTGSLNVNGVDFWISAWKRRPDAPEKAPALSFSIKAKEDAKPAAKPASPPPGNFDDFEDDLIPF
jgi:hypothetical protein